MCHVFIGCLGHVSCFPLVCSCLVTLIVGYKSPCHCLVPGHLLMLLPAVCESSLCHSMSSLFHVESVQVKSSLFGLSLDVWITHWK